MRRVVFICLLIGCTQRALAMSFGGGMDVTVYSRTPSTLNVSAADDSVTCQYTVVASTTPVLATGCSWTSPSGLYTRSCASTTPISGTTSNGVWSCSTLINKNEESGTWSNSSIWIMDTSNNKLSETKAALVAGLPISAADLEVEVTSATPDTFGPSLAGATAVPSTVYQDDGATVTCTMEVIDKGGVADATCLIESPLGTTVSCAAIEGDGDDWSCPFVIDTGADLGAWTFTNLAARDRIGNITCLDDAGTALTVTAGSAP